MFVRKKRNRSGSISIQIIDKSYGTYRVLKTVGSSSDEEEIERLYRSAISEIPHMLDQLTLSLFEQDKRQEIHAVEDLGNDDIRVVGPELVFARIFDRIGYSQIPERLFKDLVISRITHPGSKLKLVEYLQENKGQIEEISFNHTKRVLENKISIVFYDMTTIYFESSDEDEMRIRGFSKDGKHHLPLVYRESVSDFKNRFKGKTSLSQASRPHCNSYLHFVCGIYHL